MGLLIWIKAYLERPLGVKGGKVQTEQMSKQTQGVHEYTVVVTKLDRLARSSRDLHNILFELESLSVGFQSLKDSWCDTTSPAGKLMLTIFGGIAEFERDLIRSRCDEGIERARKLGKRFGRPERLDAGQKRKIAEFYAQGKTMTELAEEYGVGVGTIHRTLRPFEASASV